MAPAMDQWIRSVRVAEGFLSRNQVGQARQLQMNWNNQVVSELAKAKAHMNLVGTRQSRAIAWATFSQMVANEAQSRYLKEVKEATHQSNAKDKVAIPITCFRPSHWSLDGKRQYQFIAMRLHECGHLQPALVERVWQVYRAKSKTKQVESDVPLPSESCVRIHVVLLEQTGVDGQYWIHSQLRSLSIKPHDGTVLYEIPQQAWSLREADVYLTVHFRTACRKAWKLLDGCGWTVEHTEGTTDSGQSGRSAPPIFTYDSFQNSKAGKANIMAYMEIMRGQYEKLVGHSLLDGNGKVARVKHPKKGSPDWSVLVQRAPGYFEVIWKSQKKKPGQSHPCGQSDFSLSVWSQFSQVAPVTDAGPFLVFLRQVHEISWDALPV